MTELSSFLLALAGFASLSLSMQRHARQAESPRWLPRQKTLRLTGWAFISLSLLIRLSMPGWRIALVEWVGALGLAATLVVLALHYRPRLVPIIPASAIALALVTLVLGLR
ncbi:MAG TPA: DUF3325 domain-containing protein [Sphingobium sp.]